MNRDRVSDSTLLINYYRRADKDKDEIVDVTYKTDVVEDGSLIQDIETEEIGE